MKFANKIVMIIVIFALMLLFLQLSNSFPTWFSTYEKTILNSVIVLIGVAVITLFALK